MTAEVSQKEKMSEKVAENLPVVILGHVDHGKSTLIGRLLCDTNSINEDRVLEVKKICEDMGQEFEYCYLLDHLREERELNVTIDITEIEFKTPLRTYTIIDAPGHVEFTRNMITGASQAKVAVLLVDAKEGVMEQTRRHAYIISLLGIKSVIVAVNKINLMNYDEKVFDSIKVLVEKILSNVNLVAKAIIPVNAKGGDNLLKNSSNMPWYSGLSFIDALNSLSFDNNADKFFCMPVQDVYRQDNQRLIAGRIESGSIVLGDEVIVNPLAKKSKVTAVLEFLNPSRTSAVIGESIGLTIADKLFVERGSILTNQASPIRVVTEFYATFFWLEKSPLVAGSTLKFRCQSQDIDCEIVEQYTRLNSSTLEEFPIAKEKLTSNVGGQTILEQNEVLKAKIKCSNPVTISLFQSLPHSGDSF